MTMILCRCLDAVDGGAVLAKLLFNVAALGKLLEPRLQEIVAVEVRLVNEVEEGIAVPEAWTKSNVIHARALLIRLLLNYCSKCPRW